MLALFVNSATYAGFTEEQSVVPCSKDSDCGLLSSAALTKESDPVPLEDESCYFSKEKINLTAMELVEKFVKDGLSGKIVKSGSGAAVACPGHLDAPAKIEIVTDFEFKKQEVSNNEVVEVILLDSSEKMKFQETNSDVEATYRLIRTPYGLRISEFDWYVRRLNVSQVPTYISPDRWADDQEEKFINAMVKAKLR